MKDIFKSITAHLTVNKLFAAAMVFYVIPAISEWCNSELGLDGTQSGDQLIKVEESEAEQNEDKENEEPS